jgi:hypothetical protein
MKPTESSMLELVRDALDLHGRTERHPYGMVAGALGVGFVLGGGLSTRLTDRLAGTALRIGIAAAWPHLGKDLDRLVRRSRDRADPLEEKGEST